MTYKLLGGFEVNPNVFSRHVCHVIWLVEILSPVWMLYFQPMGGIKFIRGNITTRPTIKSYRWNRPISLLLRPYFCWCLPHYIFSKKPNLIFSNFVQGLVHSTIMKAFGKKRCVFLCVSALNLTALCFYIPWIFQVPLDTYMHLHRYLKLIFFSLYIYTEISSSNFKR